MTFNSGPMMTVPTRKIDVLAARMALTTRCLSAISCNIKLADNPSNANHAASSVADLLVDAAARDLIRALDNE